MWGLYQLAVATALAVAAPYLLIRRGRHYLETLPGRLGRYEGGPPGAGLWIHAVSVGEVGVAATLAAGLPREVPLLVTTVTPTGQARAREVFEGRGTVAYLPFDLGFAVRRFYRRFAPAALVLVEGDYWPLVLRGAARRGLPIAVVNGRLSDRSFPRLRRLRRCLGPLFSPVGRFGVQTDVDRERLQELGVPGERITTTGNLKYDTPEPPELAELRATVRRLAGERPILVAGSTMAGEEDAVAEAFGALGGGRRALLVVAPRHPERWDRAAADLAAHGLRVARRSRSPGDGADALLLDSLGELASLYRLASAAFIGGTLVPTGGHNPLEAARFGVPTAVGPSMENFREIARDFDRHAAWVRVADAPALARCWTEWLEAPESAAEVGRRAAAIVDANRGALERTLRLLEPLLGSLGGASARP